MVIIALYNLHKKDNQARLSTRGTVYRAAHDKLAVLLDVASGRCDCTEVVIDLYIIL